LFLIGGEQAQMPRKERNHGPVEKSPSLSGAAPDNGQMAAGKGNYVKKADKLIHRHHLAVNGKPFFGRSDHHLQVPGYAAMRNGSFDG
jgi:hypothetical protein